MSEKIRIKNYCSFCQLDSNHEVLFKIVDNGDDEYYHHAWVYMTVQCLGCENISYRTVYEDYESSYVDEDNNWRHDTTITTYPSSIKYYKNLKYTHILPDKIKIVFMEAINAFRSECYLLTGVAFRAVIEAVCIENDIKGRNLEFKINNLSRAKLITEKEATRLHSIRFIGNDSIHSMSVPKTETLYLVLEIIEHLLKNLYIIDYRSKDKLETLISEYSDFITLLNKELKGFSNGDEYPLAKYFGKDMRLMNGNLSNFEKELMTKITSGEYTKLSIGKVAEFPNSKDSLQHFILSKS